MTCLFVKECQQLADNPCRSMNCLLLKECHDEQKFLSPTGLIFTSNTSCFGIAAIDKRTMTTSSSVLHEAWSNGKDSSTLFRQPVHNRSCEHSCTFTSRRERNPPCLGASSAAHASVLAAHLHTSQRVPSPTEWMLPTDFCCSTQQDSPEETRCPQSHEDL